MRTDAEDVPGTGRRGPVVPSSADPVGLAPPTAVAVSDFATAAAATLKHLHARVGLETWAVARRDGEDYVVLSALDAADVGLRAGDVMVWQDTFCGAVDAGRAPRFSVEVERETGWDRALRATGFPWRSYLSVPLTAPDGTVLGTLCAGGREAVDPALEQRLPEVELAADLLATVLSYELRLEQEARRAEQAEAVAERDALTGVGNRRAWDSALAAEEARARRLGSTASVLVVDLDGLKALNDTQGHDAGDALLVRAAQVVRDHLGPGDVLARLGGDEFAALLPGAHRAATATVLTRLRGGLAAAGVRASLGAATRRAATGLDTAWREADRVAAAAVLARVRAGLGAAAVQASLGAATRRAVTGLETAWREADAAMYADKGARAGQAVAPHRVPAGAGPFPTGLLETAPQPVGGSALNARIDRLLDVARRQLGMDAAVLGQFAGDTWTLRHTASAPGTFDLRGFNTHRNATYCQRVLEGSLEPVVADADAHPLTSTLPITATLGIGAYVGVPVRLDDGSVYGTLCALSTTPQPGLRERDAGVLGIIAEALGELLTHEQLRVQERRSVLTRLDELHLDGGPRPVYQPVVELAGLRPVGHEALSRFPVGAPDTWFTDAARVGAGQDLELAAVRAALQQRPAGDGFLSLNVSPALAASPALARALDGWSREGLVLEITEHEAVADYPALLRYLAPLREDGLRIAVDDAGAGFASLRHVLALEPEFIKLDMSLIRDVHLDGTRRALVASLTTFAHQTGARVVAEGVENVHELQCLRDLGVSHGQGYHLGRPAPSTAAGDPAR